MRCVLVSRHIQLTTAENVAWNCTFFTNGIGLFRHIFFNFFFLFCREKATKFALSPPMTVSFFNGHFVRKFLFLLVLKSIRSPFDGTKHSRSLYKIMKINGWKFASQRKIRSSIKRSFWFANYSTTFQRVQVRWYARLRDEHEPFVALWCFDWIFMDDNFLCSPQITNTLTSFRVA